MSKSAGQILQTVASTINQGMEMCMHLHRDTFILVIVSHTIF